MLRSGKEKKKANSFQRSRDLSPREHRPLGREESEQESCLVRPKGVGTPKEVVRGVKLGLQRSHKCFR